MTQDKNEIYSGAQVYVRVNIYIYITQIINLVIGTYAFYVKDTNDNVNCLVQRIYVGEGYSVDYISRSIQEETSKIKITTKRYVIDDDSISYV